MNYDQPRHMKKAKPSRQRRYGIELRYASEYVMLASMHDWHVWKWYESKEQRDQAISDLRKSAMNAGRVHKEFRPVER